MKRTADLILCLVFGLLGAYFATEWVTTHSQSGVVLLTLCGSTFLFSGTSYYYWLSYAGELQ